VDDVRTAPANGLTLAYQSFGDPHAVPILLVMGLGTQMLGWPAEFCQLLADAGHHVTRFDNRDMGLSTHLDDLPRGQPVAAFFGRTPPYLLADMAQDTAELIAALGHGSMHVVGISMGGCISQILTLEYPARVRSLTSMSSTTGSRRVGRPRLDIARRMVTQKAARTKQEAIEIGLANWRQTGSPGYPFDEDRQRRRVSESWDRRYDPAGNARQFAALLAAPDRTAALAEVDVPTLVLHGEADPLIDVTGGQATARAIPDARLVTYPGMGHDLPEALWPAFVAEIGRTVAQGEAIRLGGRTAPPAG
jgi:pimeloyl-ACP methyl ester carboxylesterase